LLHRQYSLRRASSAAGSGARACEPVASWKRSRRRHNGPTSAAVASAKLYIRSFAPSSSFVARHSSLVVATLFSPGMNVLLLSMPDSFEHMAPIAIRMPNGVLTSLAGNLDPHHRVAVADLILAPNCVLPTVERL